MRLLLLAGVLAALAALASADGQPVPVKVQLVSDVSGTVSMCPLDWQARAADPSGTAHFRTWASKTCAKPTQMRMTELIAREERQLTPPKAFIFQSSRCGSTLVANMFASLPEVASYSESEPPKGVLACQRCSPEFKTRALRAVLSAMSNTGGQHPGGAVFKLQSSMALSLQEYLKAFPDVPWIFLYREPVEIMQSHVTGPGPCVRAQKRARPEVLKVLGVGPSEARDLDSDTYCAAHTAALFSSALEAADSGRFRAPLLVNYEELPAAVPDRLAAAVGVQVTTTGRERMMAAASVYSKGQSHAAFSPDSEKKQQGASARVRAAAERFALPLYGRLERLRQGAAVAQATEEVPAAEAAEQATAAAAAAAAAAATTGGVPADYPQLWSIADEILPNWSPDDPDEPASGKVFNSLRYFDYETQLDEALLYRDAEMPFVVTGFSGLAAASERWTDEYLIQQFGASTKHTMQRHVNNHFMYWRKPGSSRPGKRPRGQQLDPNAPGVQRPYETVAMTYAEYSKIAHESTLPGHQPGPGDPHYYLQTGSSPRLPFIARDLPFFLPKKSFWMVDPAGNTGIHCRFGMRGVIAEGHYDGRRNFIAMIRGAKRYILAPPSECKNFHMYQRPHPSARHTQVNLSNVDREAFPNFLQARGLEVVLRQGEIMYLPSYWIHHIVSLDQSMQCNSRSGHAQIGRDEIAKCGFY